MTWLDVFDAFRQLLTDEWTGAPIAFQNEEFEQVYGTAWIYAELLPVDGDMSRFNSPGQRIKSGIGLLAFTIMVPTGTGLRDALVIAEDVAAMINLRTLGAGIETGPAEIAGAGSDDDEGNWFRLATSAPVYINATV